MPHPSEHDDAGRALGADEAEDLAQALRAFGSASRLKLLWALAPGEQTVESLAATVGMEQSAVSHQLRILRQHRLVAVRRDGRHAHYRLFDHHLPDLLAALRHHHEHVQSPVRSNTYTADSISGGSTSALSSSSTDIANDS
jgi:DNA-binding transcriptional ArsR family regulator